MAFFNDIEAITLSSLAKVFPERICGSSAAGSEVAAGQQLSFQIAYRRGVTRDYYTHYNIKEYDIKVCSALSDNVSIYKVGLVPSELAAYPDRRDDNYITHDSGLFPDPLYPIDDGKISIAVDRWCSMWVCVDIPADTPAGEYPISVEISSDSPQESATVTYNVTVRPVALPEQRLLYTQWFHCDCIADAHGVEIFSEAHWSLIEKYMCLAAKHGMNMILTPVLTPPLDTAVGAERPTVQLVDITRADSTYIFDFSRLVRYVDMARSCGIDNFEINHFFTQWGAAFCPKTVATVDGKKQIIFGWQTAADDGEYVKFLGQLVPALIGTFERLGIKKDQLWFHVSDEPHKAHLEQYRISEGILHDLIKGCHHIDALSDYEFYKEGIVETPVVATNKIEPYLEANVPDLWCYYCCGQGVDVANRFFSMPSARNRIIGVQMYKFGIKGFLQWGYNFYYTQLSKRKIDPYRETDGGCAFPSGDAFSVYPYGDGVIPSLRQKVFLNALEDIRLLELLEQRIGREKVVEAIDRIAGMNVTFSQYPHEEDFFEKLYKFIFDELK